MKRLRHRISSVALVALVPGLLILGTAGPSSAAKVACPPICQQAKVGASDASTAAQFGISSAVSSNGSTALVGASGKTSSAGAAYAFTRSGTTWSQQQKLSPSDTLAAGDLYGAGVALSSDGNTGLVGAPGRATSTGAVYVFTRSGSTWTQQAKLTATGGAHSDKFGAVVALSSDGNTAAVGAPGRSSSAGAVYIFTRSGSTWTQQATLTPSDAAANDQFGAAVALSSSSSFTLLAGAPHKASSAGATYAFTGSGSTWTQQQKLTATGGAANDQFGNAVSLAGDGNTGLIGAPGVTSFAGAGYVFTRSGSTWTQQTQLLSSTQTIGNQLGESVSISTDGQVALLGSPGVKHSTGSALVYLHKGSKWSRQPKLVGSGSVASDSFGSSVAASSDGSTLLAGADGTATSTGSLYVFAITFPPTIASITPNTGKVGDPVVIAGTHLTGATAVTFNGTTSTFTVDNDGQITVTTPAGSVTGAGTFKVKPTITDFSPLLGSPGTLVTIDGTGLAGTTAVSFNGTAAVFTIVNPTRVTATVPALAATGKISVTTTGGGTAKSLSGFHVTP